MNKSQIGHSHIDLISQSEVDHSSQETCVFKVVFIPGPALGLAVLKQTLSSVIRQVVQVEPEKNKVKYYNHYCGVHMVKQINLFVNYRVFVWDGITCVVRDTEVDHFLQPSCKCGSLVRATPLFSHRGNAFSMKEIGLVYCLKLLLSPFSP